jgi:excinuclease ABC subunit A
LSECEGYGKVIGIDEDLVIPNKNLSVFEDAVACWRGETMSEWKKISLKKLKISLFINLIINSPKSRKIIFGEAKKKNFPNIDNFFKMLEENLYKIQYRVMLSRYRGKTTCPTCEGKRLRPETEYVKIDGHNIQSLVELPLDELFL